jgi:hypothetical protein
MKLPLNKLSTYYMHSPNHSEQMDIYNKQLSNALLYLQDLDQKIRDIETIEEIKDIKNEPIKGRISQIERNDKD